MPWCDECAKYWTPNAMAADGSCPTCGAKVASARELRSEERLMGADGRGDDAPAKAPWHFKAMLGALTLYLGWRVVQGVEWVVHRF